MASTLRIFHSVFPPPSDISTPTPTTTPLLPSSSFGDSPFHAPPTQHTLHDTGGGSAAEQIKWDRAWHTTTTFLSLPDEPISGAEGEEGVRKRWCKSCDTETEKAFEYLLSEKSKGRVLRRGKDGEQGEDLLRWWFEGGVVRHYLRFLLPILERVSGFHEFYVTLSR